MTAPSLPPLTVLPVTAAYDYAYFRDLLADPSVLATGVAVRIARVPLLAVPVGGPRRGGYFPVPNVTVGLAVRGLLAHRPGFPAPRLRWAPYRDTCHVVEWGDVPPVDDDAARGRFYGYRETAIAAFLSSPVSAAPSASPVRSRR
ncbi:DUF6302 family protein [Streptomyces sp. UNOC14_S4]|uniref:DUF6302 family protein n=1 Tax=Streptomyces sp. UNOC14_S4 TaxID=2872340 RepID=UPI001E42FB37|nr:DUF6302 family protein [Streptomyces sp. UNOC14_S4]MCC3767639.1 hypothetical protein [Streptomyces sp. UNOC14_S4]